LKTIVKVKEGIFDVLFAILLLTALSGFSIWWAIKSNDVIMLILVSAASMVWLFLVCVVAKSFYRGQSAILGIDDGILIWEVTTKHGDKADRESILATSIQMLELVFPRDRWKGKNYRNYRFADAFLVDVAGKRHQIPDALMPGVYYKNILKALREVKPGVVLNERFDDSSDV
jgi:hypothetical protein